MGKLTPEREDEILKEYQKKKVYSEVAKALGINWRTVRKVVVAARKKQQENAPIIQSTPGFQKAQDGSKDAHSLTKNYEFGNSSSIDEFGAKAP